MLGVYLVLNTMKRRDSIELSRSGIDADSTRFVNRINVYICRLLYASSILQHL